MGTWIRYSGVRGARTRCIYARGSFVGGVKPRALAGSGVTLAGPEVNHCYLRLFMGLIFASMDGVSY